MVACPSWLTGGAGGTWAVQGNSHNVNLIQGASGQQGGLLGCELGYPGQSGFPYVSPNGGNGGNSGLGKGLGGAGGVGDWAQGAYGQQFGGGGGGGADPAAIEWCHSYGCNVWGGYGAGGFSSVSWGSQGTMPTLITASNNPSYGTVQQSGISATSATYEARSYSAGTKVQISATSTFYGYQFGGWSCSGAGCYNGNNSTATIIIGNGTITETANIQPAPETLTVYNGTGSGTYSYGSAVTISAPISEIINSSSYVCSSGSCSYYTTTTTFYFDGWSCTGTGCYSGVGDATTFTIQGNTTETAMYGLPASNGFGGGE